MPVAVPAAGREEAAGPAEERQLGPLRHAGNRTLARALREGGGTPRAAVAEPLLRPVFRPVVPSLARTPLREGGDGGSAAPAGPGPAPPPAPASPGARAPAATPAPSGAAGAGTPASAPMAAAPAVLPAPAPSAPAQQDAAADGPADVKGLLAHIASKRGHCDEKVTATKARLESFAQTQHKNIEAARKSEVDRVAKDIDNEIEHVRKAASDAQKQLDDGRTKDVKRVQDAHQAQIKKLDGLIKGKQDKMREAARRQADAAIAGGEAEAKRATDQTNVNAAEALKIGTDKAASFQNTKRGGEKARAAGDMARGASQEILKSGGDIAKTAREDAKKLADNIRKEGDEAAEKLSADQVGQVRQKLDKRRDDAIKGIEDAARKASEQIKGDADKIVTELGTQKTGATDGIGQVATAAGKAVDDQKARAGQQADKGRAEIETKLKEGEQRAPRLAGHKASEFTKVQASLDESVSQADAGMDKLATDAEKGMSGVAEQALTKTRESGEKLLEPLKTKTAEFKARTDEATGKTTQAMTKEGDDASKEITDAVSGVERELDKAIADAERKWQQKVADGLKEIATKVDGGLAEQRKSLTALAADIDKKAQEIENESLLDRAWNFTKGLIAGFLHALWETIKILLIVALVVIAIAVVALIIAAIFFGIEGVLVVIGAIIAIVEFIAAIGTILLIIAVVIVALVAAYKLWKAWSDPNLTDFERGHLVGEVVFDAVSLIFGAKFAKWLGELAGLGRAAEGGIDLARLARLRGIVTDEALLGRLLALIGKDGVALEKLLAAAGNDAAALERLFLLVGKDAAKLERLLGIFSRDAAKLEKLLGDLGGDVAKLEKLLAAVGNDVSKLDDLIKAFGGDVAKLEKLLADVGGDAAKLQEALTLCGGDVARLEKLLKATNNSVDDVKALIKGVNGDLAMLDRLLLQTDDAAQLKRLLDAYKDGAKLEAALTKAGGKANAQLLDDLVKTAGNDTTKLDDLLNLTNGNGTRFRELAEAGPRFKAQSPPTGPQPAGATGAGYSSADMKHFLERHTYEFFDMAGVKGRQGFWPDGTTPQDVAKYVDEAIAHLHPPPPATPVPPYPNGPAAGFNIPSGFKVKFGGNAGTTPPYIGQFYPESGPGVITITKAELKALFKIKAFPW